MTTLPLPHVDGVEHRYAVVDGVRIHYAQAGDPEREPVFLVHGWPQHWWSWRELIGPLAERYRVICPDIRGMGWSQAPRQGYAFRDLAGELFGLMDALGLARAKLVGHDWGLGLGYLAAVERPDRIERFVGMGGPHIWAADGAPLGLYLRAWHVYVNASPLGALATRRLYVPEACLRYWRAAGSFTRDEIEVYTAPLRRDGSARATVQRYRTFLLEELRFFRTRFAELRLRVPTLHLNGAEDPLVHGVPDNWRRYADDMRYELLPGVGHFLAEEAPAEVTDRVLAFLARGQAGGNGVAPSGRRPSSTIAR